MHLSSIIIGFRKPPSAPLYHSQSWKERLVHTGICVLQYISLGQNKIYMSTSQGWFNGLVTLEDQLIQSYQEVSAILNENFNAHNVLLTVDSLHEACHVDLYTPL